MENRYIKHLIFIIIPLFFLLGSCAQKPDFDSNDKVVQQIVEKNTDSVDVSKYFPDHDVRNFLHKEFNEFYRDRDYALAWLTFEEPKKQADALLETIDAAHQEGLSPEHYNVEQIENLLSELYNIDSRKERRRDYRKAYKSKEYKNNLKAQDTVLFNKIVRLDFLMTASYMTYASHMLSGLIKPDESAEWYSEPRTKDLSEYLKKAVEDGKIHESLIALNPPHPQYDRLREKLSVYRKIKDNGGWDLFNIEKNLSPGNKGGDVYKLKKRLAIIQLFEEEQLDSVYGENLKTAVEKYQMMHGLEVTGKVNGKTLAELNKPVDEVIKKIAFSMERMRWIHGPFGDHYILVNIPAFKMQVIKDEKPVVEMRAIVGEKVNKTPVFYDSLEYIVFSPEWNVPRSIAVKEMLPQIKKDPNYLRDRNYMLFENWSANAQQISQNSIDWEEVDEKNFNFRIVEGPGDRNSLGRVKFIFPNNNAIYLHDTPADHLFSRNERDFSHGCVRLEKPKDFALYLLEDQGWTLDKINDYMNKSEPQTILLDQKLPVYIVYWTAWVDPVTNRLNLRNDVYNYDSKQMKKLENKEEDINSNKLGTTKNSK